MPSLLDRDTESAKIVYLGDSGHGKTGSKASLVAAGYKLRMIDTDNGFKILRSMLTDRRYPYAAYMEKAGIDPSEPGRISYIPIDVPMDMVTLKGKTMPILAPTSSAGWNTAVNHLKEWKDGDINLGPVTDWDNDCVLDLDTISTLAEVAKYWNQDMNGRMGAIEDDHGRDTGAAQEMIRRLTMKLTSPSVKCNVIATTHITWVDTTRGAPQNPSALLREHKSVDPRGFPSIIGQALSPVFGKRWNDMFVVRRTGNNRSAERRIYSVPTDNVDAKHSAYVDESYPLETGLAQIFAALLYKDPPLDLIKAVEAHKASRPDPDNSQPNGSGPGGRQGPFGGFSR